MKTYQVLLAAVMIVMVGVLGNTGILTLSALSLIAFGINQLKKADNYSKTVIGIGSLSAALLLTASIIFPEFSIGLTVPGAILAVTPVLGGDSVTETSDQSRDDVFVRDVDDKIHMIGVDDFPFTTMKYNLKKAKRATSQEIEWYEDTYYDREDSISGTVTAAAGTGPHTVTLANPSKFVKGNIISIPSVDPIAGNSQFDDLKLRIASINYANGEATTYVVNHTALPEIPDTSKVYRLTMAGSEHQAQVQTKHKIPDRYTNYVQRFMGQIEISKLKQMVKTYTDDDKNREMKKQVYDFRISEEMADLFGVKDRATDADDGSDVFYQAGIEAYAGQYFEYTESALTNADIISLCRTMFARNNGSKSRLWLVDDAMLEDILSVDFIQKQLDAGSTKVVLGVECQEIRTSFGKLYIKHHKGFAEAGRTYYGMVIDMANVYDRVMKDMHKTELKLKESGQKNVDATLVEKYKSLEVVNAKAHGIVKAVSA